MRNRGVSITASLRGLVARASTSRYGQPCHTLSHVPETIAWGDDATKHLRTRSARHPGATDIDPAWTVDVVNDPERLVDEPDPR